MLCNACLIHGMILSGNASRSNRERSSHLWGSLLTMCQSRFFASKKTFTRSAFSSVHEFSCITCVTSIFSGKRNIQASSSASLIIVCENVSHGSTCHAIRLYFPSSYPVLKRFKSNTLFSFFKTRKEAGIMLCLCFIQCACHDEIKFLIFSTPLSTVL